MAGHIRKRGPNTFLVIVELGRDGDGKRIQVRKQISNATLKEAKALLARMETQHGNTRGADLGKTTLGQFFHQWLRTYAEGKVSAKTYQTYEEFIRLHLEPGLGRHQLAKLQPMHIQNYYNTAVKNGRKDGKGGLSARSVHHHHRLLREVLQFAVKWGFLDRNPADLADPPTVPKAKKPKRLQDGDAKRLFAEIQGTPLYVPSLISICTSMRRGEILALLWDDVDLETGLVQVYRSLSQTRKGLHFKGTKRAENVRETHLPSELLPLLKRHRSEQAARQLMLGGQYQDHGLVCCWEDGRPIQPDYLTKAFTKRARRLGITSSFHGLRHTHLSQLAEDGENPRAVSNRGGHSKVETTLNLYTDLSPEVDQGIAARYNKRLRGLIARSENGAVDASESA